ncbi:protein kinase C-binding protein 1, partial [Caerostris extrusa]
MKVHSTTDKPFITVIKPESSRARKCLSFEEVEDNSFEYESPSSNSKANSAETSPYKNFPDVSVCLKEEDHINVQRELGKTNDCYCWVCHRENVTLTCIACPRAFHQKCAGNYVDMNDYKDWVCPECKRILQAENVDTQSTVLSEISLDKLCSLLKFSLNKMKHRAGVAFHQPVSLDHYPMYLHYIINQWIFSLLEK